MAKRLADSGFFQEDDENDDEGEGAAATKIVQCDDDVEDMSGCEDGGDCGDDDAGRTAAEAAAILTDGRYMCVERYSQQTQAVACGDHVLCKLRPTFVRSSTPTTPAFVPCPCSTLVISCKQCVCECFECLHSQTLCLHVEHSQTLCLHEITRVRPLVRTGDFHHPFYGSPGRVMSIFLLIQFRTGDLSPFSGIH